MNRLACHLLLLGFGTTASAQLPCWNPNYGTSLGLTDESMSAAQALGFTFDFDGVGYTDIQVCDNGYITLGPTGGLADWSPSPITLTTDAFARICPFWSDLEPGLPGNGDVFFRSAPAANGDPAHAVITWLDCINYAGSIRHTFQLVLIDGGAIRCSYDANLTQNTNPWLIGASPGGGATQNPVNFATLPLLTSGNATLHQYDGIGSPAPLSAITVDWTPDGSNGYTITQVIGCAGRYAYGTGCIGRFTSFYEWFTTTPAIDLSNSSFRMTLTGSSYVVSQTTTAFVAPTAAASNLNLTDDSETLVTLATSLPYPAGTTTTLMVGSNGTISTATNTAASDYTPTPTEFLAWPETTWAVWRDFIPGAPGGGNVMFEEVGNLSIFTWDGVLGYSGQQPGTTPSTHQLQFDRSTGDVEFVFGQLDTTSISGWTGGEGWIVGYTPGGPSIDPGSIDLSVTLGAGTIDTDPADLAPLSLTASARPITNTSINFEVDHITPTAAFGGMLIGLIQFNPGINLASLGMPTCFRYNDQLVANLFFPGGASMASVPFIVPNFAGVQIEAQAASYDPQASLTPLGAVTSNGIALVIGL